MADTVPPVVKTEKDWLRISQFIAVALIPVLQGVQLGIPAKPVDPNAPAPPPVVTPLESFEKRLTERLDAIDGKLDSLTAPKPKK